MNELVCSRGVARSSKIARSSKTELQTPQTEKTKRSPPPPNEVTVSQQHAVPVPLLNVLDLIKLPRDGTFFFNPNWDECHEFNGWDAGSHSGIGRWHSPSPNWQEKYHLYTTYSPCLLGGLYATYHLLGEPETNFDECHEDTSKVG